MDAIDFFISSVRSNSIFFGIRRKWRQTPSHPFTLTFEAVSHLAYQTNHKTFVYIFGMNICDLRNNFVLFFFIRVSVCIQTSRSMAMNIGKTLAYRVRRESDFFPSPRPCFIRSNMCVVFVSLILFRTVVCESFE